MIPVEQQQMAVFDEHGDNVQRGDCMRACVASLFELPLEDVPHFVEQNDWHGEWVRWLRARGLGIYDARIRVDDDPTRLTAYPGDGYWLATVKSPRGRERCAVCKGDKVTVHEWVGGDYVRHDEPQPCRACDATGLVPAMHLVVMEGPELVWDPHPRRDMGHLGFVSGQILRLLDPTFLAGQVLRPRRIAGGERVVGGPAA